MELTSTQFEELYSLLLRQRPRPVTEKTRSKEPELWFEPNLPPASTEPLGPADGKKKWTGTAGVILTNLALAAGWSTVLGKPVGLRYRATKGTYYSLSWRESERTLSRLVELGVISVSAGRPRQGNKAGYATLVSLNREEPEQWLRLLRTTTAEQPNSAACASERTNLIIRDAEGVTVKQESCERLTKLNRQVMEHSFRVRWTQATLNTAEVYQEEKEGGGEGYSPSIADHLDMTVVKRPNLFQLSADQLHLTRIFKETRDSCGRLYANYQSDFRRREVTEKGMPLVVVLGYEINGEQCVEVDVTSYHPRIIYNLAGREAPKDCYSPELNFLPGVSRSHIKRAVNVLLNAGTKPKAIASLTDGRPGKNGLRASEGKVVSREYASALFEAILKAQPVLQNWAFSEAYRRLQYLDGEVNLLVLEDILALGIGVLPWHDSWLVPLSGSVQCKAAICQAYREVIGMELPTAALEVKSNWGLPADITCELKRRTRSI